MLSFVKPYKICIMMIIQRIRLCNTLTDIALVLNTVRLYARQVYTFTENLQCIPR